MLSSQRWSAYRLYIFCVSAGDKEGATSNSRQSDSRNKYSHRSFWMKKTAIFVETGCRRSVWTAVGTAGHHRHGELDKSTRRSWNNPFVHRSQKWRLTMIRDIWSDRQRRNTAVAPLRSAPTRYAWRPTSVPLPTAVVGLLWQNLYK